MLSQKWLLFGLVGLCACGGAPISETPSPLPSDGVDGNVIGVGSRTADQGVPDDSATYRQIGFVASGPPISFVGSTAFFATQSPDTTLTVVSLSIPNRGLAFSPEGKSYEAVYGVSLRIFRNSVEVRRVDDMDTVRVGSLKETHRTDESILFRHAMRFPPGEYVIAYTIQDGTAGREVTQRATLRVPQFGATSISRPVVVYGGTPRARLSQIPQYLPKPRASAVLGIDKTVSVYLEAYGTRITTPVLCALRDMQDSIIWRDTVWLAQRNELAASVFSVPVGQANIGRLMLSAVRPGSIDTMWAPLFMGFGPDLPAVSFTDMVSYLRYFATIDWQHRLRKASSTSRGAVWADFLRATDSLSSSSSEPSHDALRSYFQRIREANDLFRNDRGQAGQGWLSDRGSVFVGLGEPDNSYEQDANDGGFSVQANHQVKLLVWEYRASGTRIVFSDEMGLGDWRLLPASAALFQRLLTLKLAG